MTEASPGHYVTFADGTMALILKVREIDKDGFPYYKITMKLTSALIAYQNLSKDINPSDNTYTCDYKKEHCFMINKDPTNGSWIFLCDVRGKQMELASLLSADLLIRLDVLQRENKSLRVALVAMAYKAEGVYGQFDETLRKQMKMLGQLKENISFSSVPTGATSAGGGAIK